MYTSLAQKIMLHITLEPKQLQQLQLKHQQQLIKMIQIPEHQSRPITKSADAGPVHLARKSEVMH